MEKDNKKKENIKASISDKFQIVTSKRDQEIIFDLLMGEEDAPNETLLSAIRSYNDLNEN